MLTEGCKDQVTQAPSALKYCSRVLEGKEELTGTLRRHEAAAKNSSETDSIEPPRASLDSSTPTYSAHDQHLAISA